MHSLLKMLDDTGKGWHLTSIWFEGRPRRYACQIGDLETALGTFSSGDTLEEAIEEALRCEREYLR